MGRQKITIEDRLREFCRTASEPELTNMRDRLNDALYIKFGAEVETVQPKPKRDRKPRQPKADQSKPAGVE